MAPRPGTDYSYTNNRPYGPLVDNVPTASTYLWSALSLVTLLAGLGLMLFLFRKFNDLGWGGEPGRKHSRNGRDATAMITGRTRNQRRCVLDRHTPRPRRRVMVALPEA